MRSIARTTLAAGAALLVSSPAAAWAADAPAPAVHVRGAISAASPTELTVTTASGPVRVKIDRHTKVVGVLPATAADITSGAFIGTANVNGESTTSARALEVVVFPDSMAGTGEGDYPWDLPAGKGRSSMTNGTVGARRSMMTNATVTGVNNGASKTVILQYKGGSKKVVIPPGTPIVRAVPATASLLVPGAHVTLVRPDAGAASPVVIVGEQGVIPPM